jgi:signal transduction histidine kinase
MRKIQVLVVALSLLFAGVVFAAENAKPAEAEALVKKAIAYVEANGKDKAFAEFDNQNGQFVKGELYLYVYDMNGKCLAHGANKQMIGLNLIGAKDPDGKQFISELVEMAKTNGKGWVDFKFMNPVTKQVQAKSGYVEKYNDIMIGSGVYK